MIDMTKVRYVRPAPHCNVTVKGLIDDDRFNNFEGNKVFDLYVLFGGNEPLARERIERCADLSKSIDAKHLRVVMPDESVEEVEVIVVGTSEEPATVEDIKEAREKVVEEEVTTEEEETPDEDDGGDTGEEPAEEVKEETKRLLDAFMPGGGFVFAAGHNTQSDVPPENVIALFDTVREYGVY